MTWPLATTAAATLLGAAVYGALAIFLWSRPGDAEARRATRAFAAYWAFTAAYQAIVAFQHALAAADVAPLTLAIVVRYLGLALASFGIGGLLGFFLYLRSGRSTWIVRMRALYVLVAALAWLHVWLSEPIGLARTEWTIDVSYAKDFQGGLFLPLLVFLNLLPVAGALWYLTLVRRSEDRRQRSRILAVGLGISLQLLSFTLARITESPLSQLVSRTVLGFVVALLVALAYVRGPMPTARAPAAMAAFSGPR